MTKDDECKVQIFDGKDYSIWKKRILLLLRWKKCDGPATREKEDKENQAEWEEKNLRAMNYIYSSVNNEQLEFVCEQTTALKILQKFDQLYVKESTALQICLRNRLDKLKLKDFENSSTFFLEFEKLINELRHAGAKVNEKEKLDYILKTLPDSLSHIGDLIDALSENERTCEYVKNKIEMLENRSKCDSDRRNTSVFKVEKKDIVCHGCGKKGHIRKDCWNPWKDETGGRGQGTGGTHQANHQHRQQQLQFRGQRGRGSYNLNNRRGYDHRGRGRSLSYFSGVGRYHDPGHGYDPRNNNNNNVFCTSVEYDHNFNNESNEFKKDIKAYTSHTLKISWILDSGCTDHIINDEKYFYEYVNLENPINVIVGDGRKLQCSKVGKVLMYLVVNQTRVEISVENVFFVKEMDKNLLSYAKVTNNFKIVSMKNTAKIYNYMNKLVGIAYKEGRLYVLTGYIKNEKALANNVSKMTEKEKLHKILGHVNFDYLNRMCKDKLVFGMPEKLENTYLRCGTCIRNKMHNVPFENNRSRASNILEIVHTDLNGPHRTIGYDGSVYFLTFIDDYSKCSMIFTIKSKSEVFDCFMEYINKVENLTDHKIKKLRCDNGKEYMNNAIFKLIRDKGILMEPCPPYVHELNGTAERYNRTIMNSARCLLDDANIPIRFWPEVVKTAAYLKNRTIANNIEKKTPFEIFFGKKPNIKNLKLYGSKVFIKVPELKRNSKWDRKADVGKLVGYDYVGYRVLINNKITVARHVDIIEDDVKLIGFNGDDGCDTKSENNFESVEVVKKGDCKKEDDKIGRTIKLCTDSEEFVNYSDQEFVDCDEQDLRRSARKRNKPERYGQLESHYIYVNYVSADSPNTYDEVLKRDDCDSWKQAMDKEMQSLIKNKTWKLVKKPNNTKVIDLRWVFTNKSTGEKKARLVVRGYQQDEKLEDIYSPVARSQTLKLLLAVCCQNKFTIEQMDVETAFLNGTVKSNVYVKQPIGYDDNSGRVYKLEKSLYGLRESPRAWYECFDKFMLELGFQKSKVDYCLYVKNDSIDTIYIILFVDDLLICGLNKKKIDEVKRNLSIRFSMKDLGKINTYLGINIQYDCEKGELTLDQSKYIESLARQYRLESSKLYSTPMEQNLNLEPAQSASKDIKYRNLIGALLYICNGTRPDTSYSVNFLSRFQNSYDSTHYKYALRILKYLYLTRNLKLIFKRRKNAEILDCFVDADWGGDKEKRKSTTGYVIRVFGNVIYWKTKKQGSVTKSSTASEYIALSEAVSELKFIKSLLNDLNVKCIKPIMIYEDNTGAISIAKFGNMTKNSKHIEIHYHFVNECYERKEIDIVKVESENNLADIFTKALGRVKFEKLRSRINIL